MISERTKAALAAAKARGVVLGGYKGGPAPDNQKGTQVLQEKAQEFRGRVAVDFAQVLYPATKSGMRM